jgi:hypothetical protein
MKCGVLWLLVLIVRTAPAVAAEIGQSTIGPRNPVQSGNYNVVNCNGVPQRGLDRLNELLDRQDLDLKQKTAEANVWVCKYTELYAQL